MTLWEALGGTRLSQPSFLDPDWSKLKRRTTGHRPEVVDTAFLTPRRSLSVPGQPFGTYLDPHPPHAPSVARLHIWDRGYPTAFVIFSSECGIRGEAANIAAPLSSLLHGSKPPTVTLCKDSVVLHIWGLFEG